MPEWTPRQSKVRISFQKTKGARLYYQGELIERDFEKALTWHSKAAESGDADSMLALSAMYMRGHGVEKDVRQAKDWLRRSAEHGHPRAWEILEEWGNP